MLEMIKRKSGMNVLFWRLKNSLDEILEKHEHRTDLIEPMQESLEEVAACLDYLNHCDKMLRADDKKIFAMEIEILQLKQKIRHLEQMNKTPEI